MAAQRVLVIGPCEGRVSEFLSKTAAIHAKHGPFSAMFVVGDLFAPQSNRDQGTLSQEERAILDGEAKRMYLGENEGVQLTFTVPVPTYFYHGTTCPHKDVQERIAAAPKYPAGYAELAPNLLYLGSAGVVETASGFRVAYCGGSAADLGFAAGSEDSSTSWSPWTPLETPQATSNALHHLLQHPSLVLGKASLEGLPAQPENLQQAREAAARYAQYAEQLKEDADMLQKRQPIDFLFTNAWPKGIDMFATAPLPDPSASRWGVAPLARLGEATRPRYYFAPAPNAMENGAYWERDPYENPPFAAFQQRTPPPSITRFYSLAKVANAAKTRWFMALSLVAADAQSPESKATAQVRPPNITPSPLVPAATAASNGSDDSPNFRFDAGAAPAAPGKRRRKGGDDAPARRRRRADVLPVGPENCWFCLSNPRVEKHLIVSVGRECYVALPKGQLPISSDASSPVPGGGHALILPIAHLSSIYNTDAAPAELRSEVAAWKAALKKCYAVYDAVPVCWEVVRRSGTRAGHTQTQVVPVPKDRLEGLESYVRDVAQEDGIEFESADVVAEFASGESADRCSMITAADREDFFSLEIDDRRLLCLLRGRRFNLQFPRETLASYLDMAERADWKACVRPEEVETAECDEFKEAFEEFTHNVVED